MKKSIILTVLLASSLAGFAAEAQRIATIDLRKAFDNYWRTKQADLNLKEQASDLEKERKVMLDQFQKSQESYKKIMDGVNDPALSSEERDKRKKSAETELMGLRTQEERVKQFDATSRTTLGEKQRRVRDQILTEIKEKIKVKAKAAGYTFVLDTAAETINNTPMLLYTSSSDFDLTDTVLAELNIGAPKERAPDADIKFPPKKK